MTFTTVTFFLFLVVVFAAYWSTQRWLRVQNLVLVLASYVFYGWWDWRFCGLLLASSTVDYCAARIIDHTDRRSVRRAALVTSLVVNFSVLGFFKYFNFFMDSFADAAELLGWHVSDVTLRIILPVGISFYTFQTASYTMDVFAGKLPATRRYIDYLAYVAFFPQLVAGPIERGANLLPQVLRPRRFDYELARQGCRQMLYGFFKKMVIADNLAPIVEAAYAQPAEMSGPQLAFATVAFAFQIYCDFSAYSDIAIGTARLFGFDLMQNFAYPYFSQSVAEFWRRWHISLSTWFRDYLYIPLGGSRVGPWRRLFNIMVTFTVSGFWHGASWNFIIWGALNGAGMVPAVLSARHAGLRLSDTPGGNRPTPSPAVVLRMVGTFAFVCLGWVFFRARTLSDAVLILQKIVTEMVNIPAYSGVVDLLGRTPVQGAVLIHLAAFLVMEWWDRRFASGLRLIGWPRWGRWAAYTALIFDILYFGTHTRGEFIYFQF